MTKIPVLKVTVEAPVTSFRYPHFLIGRQASYDMPPPSTIYGHIAGASGELLDPSKVLFGYDFRFLARGADLEHQHILTAAGPKATFTDGTVRWRGNTDATVQPHLRDFLFQPKLTLYVRDLDLAPAFRSPAFCVILGRSQDLAAYTRVEEGELEQRDGAYLENTLVPFSYRPFVGRGVTVLMPRYIEPPPERRAHFERYIVLHERVFGGECEGVETIAPNRRVIGQPGERGWWVDPATPPDRGVHRAVLFHTCA
jgi:CRISPR-associated protein Cas5t